MRREREGGRGKETNPIDSSMGNKIGSNHSSVIKREAKRSLVIA